jgi:hypothetical protein
VVCLKYGGVASDSEALRIRFHLEIEAAILTSEQQTMHTIAIKLHAEHLANPDLDIRYVLPNLLKERSGGIISDDGYDYVGDDNDLVFPQSNGLAARHCLHQ